MNSLVHSYEAEVASASRLDEGRLRIESLSVIGHGGLHAVGS